MNLLLQQDQLQKEAYKVLEHLQLISTLKKYGEPKIIGSLDLGLMTWKDIDIEVVTQKLDKESLGEIAQYLISKMGTRIDLGIIDNTRKGNNGLPDGFYLGIKFYSKYEYHKEKEFWKIDLWFVEKQNAQGRIKTEQIKEKLTPEKTAIILEIKNEVAQNPKYRKEIFSMDIYNAVLGEQVKDLEGFKIYLKNFGKSL